MTVVQKADKTASSPAGADRRKLIAIALVLLMVVSTPALLWWRGSRSTAAFADSEVLETNHLGAGTLDLEIGPETVTFHATNLAPGDVVTGQLELISVGTLPLTFVVSARSDGGILAQWLRFGLWQSNAICRPDQVGSLIATDVLLTPDSTILAGSPGAGSNGASSLAPGETSRFCLGARLPIDAPNDVQGQSAAVDVVVDAVHDLEAEQ